MRIQAIKALNGEEKEKRWEKEVRNGICCMGRGGPLCTNWEQARRMQTKETTSRRAANKLGIMMNKNIQRFRKFFPKKMDKIGEIFVITSLGVCSEPLRA